MEKYQERQNLQTRQSCGATASQPVIGTANEEKVEKVAADVSGSAQKETGSVH